ncbi:helix-turn-helix transcriptional regulator [Streptomyces sp. ERV7]|uniref:helix-turn-helix transcriptional regulator n=1 Tax=Streptomyces sp. ERV7 TaxID=1322334 RepID=UPI0007F48F53|nr:helix-turn-helix transcriptional regulator [Streptomyces sp. ERV7]OAR27604.1 helix-turn-helix transcriptional regulator [Streptomyces sp. ERV7]
MSAIDDTGLPTELRRLGLGPGEAAVYTTLLRCGRMPVAELAERLGQGPEEAEHLTRRLTGLGLVALLDADSDVLSPVEPTIALDQLAHARSAELRHAHVAALNAFRAFRRSVHSQPTDDLVEVVSGPQVAERVWQVEGAAVSEVLRFDSPPYHTAGGPNPTEVEKLARGVVYRVVYSASAVRSTSYYTGNIQPCIAAGEQARVLPTVPVKLTVFDRRLAIVSMSSVEAESNDSLLLVRPSSLLSALTGLFETAWRAAHPMHLSGQVPRALRPVQRRILELLATGVNDDNIADLLGISRRTLSRNLEQLHQLAGSVSRFQLALHAARHDWI